MIQSLFPDPNVPRNLPVASPGRADPGWAPVGVDELVKTHYQYFSFYTTPPSWQISSYLTSEGYKNEGRVSYRRPTSLKAWLTVLPQVALKLIRRPFRPKPPTS